MACVPNPMAVGAHKTQKADMYENVARRGGYAFIALDRQRVGAVWAQLDSWRSFETEFAVECLR